LATDDREYERALDNPDNFIVSEELEGILSIDDMPELDHDSYHTIVLNGKHHVFEFIKVKRLPSGFYKFKGHVPSFPLPEYLRGAGFKLSFYGETFSLYEKDPASFSSDGILTFTARRIISNEEVPV